MAQARKQKTDKPLSFLKKISSNRLSDQQLVASFKESGDTRILGELYQPYMDLLFAVCLKYLKDPEKAKDAVMAIFEELVVKLRKHDVGYFKGWVYTVVRNHCLMQLRSANQLVTREIDADRMHLPEELHLEKKKKKELKLGLMGKCLDSLSLEQRKTVELFYLKEKSYKEIAQLSGMDHNKVRSLIQNGRRNLKICMQAAEKEGVVNGKLPLSNIEASKQKKQ